MPDALNFDETTERVYRAVLTRERVRADELARLLDLEEPRLTHALAELARLALIDGPDDELGVSATDPAAGIRSLAARERAELVERHRELDHYQSSIRELIELYSRITPPATGAPARTPADAAVETVEGQRMTERVMELMRGCAHEVATFHSNVHDIGPYLKIRRMVDPELIARGVQVRSVLTANARIQRQMTHYAGWLNEQGGIARTSAAVPMCMMLFDRRVAVLPVDPEQTGGAWLVARYPGIVAVLSALFDQTWRSAFDFDGPELRDDQAVTGQETEMLRLLAQGLTDEAISKSLGISVRAACRMSADLMRRLSARSRFQAGVNAYRRGWIPD